ncbi:MAG: magnesium/cobalt transporter CorA [Saprospiraceae bacterium]
MSPKRNKKGKKSTGLAPGTIVFTGKRKVEQIKIHYLAYNEQEMNFQDLDNQELANFHQDDPNFIQWYDVRGLHDAELITAIGQIFKVHPLSLEDTVDTFQRPKVDEYEAQIFVTLKALSFSKAKKQLHTEHISLLLGSDFILSFQEDADDLFHSVRTRLEKSSGRIRKRKADYLLYALMDSIVDQYYLVLEALEDEMEALEADIIAHADLSSRSTIYALRQELVDFRKMVFPLRELLKTILTLENEIIQEPTMVYLRDLHDHVVQVLEINETYRDNLNGLQDLLLSELSFRTNSVMQVLTIVSTIFIPLTFLAGIYGMNFDHMPELHWRYGYFALLGVMLLVFVVMVIYFRRKKWL